MEKKLTVTDIKFKGFSDFEQAFIKLSDGTEEELKPVTLSFSDKTLFCTTEKAGITAFETSPAVEILDRIHESDGEYSVTLCGTTVVLRHRGSK